FGDTALGANFLDHLVCWPEILAGAVRGGAKIVHQDLGPVCRQHLGMLRADPAAGAGYDTDPSFTQSGHVASSRMDGRTLARTGRCRSSSGATCRDANASNRLVGRRRGSAAFDPLRSLRLPFG